MGKNFFKKSVAIILAVAMLISALPLSIFATDVATASEGFVSETHDLFKSTTSTIAPGVTQTINYAYAKDGNQMVYYVAVADVNRDDVIVQTSYKEQYRDKKFGMEKLTEHMAFADTYYTDETNDKFISEYYKAVAGVNASFYNMTTGQPSGVTYLDGVQIGESSSYAQFFAILKDGKAIIDYTKNLSNYEGNIEQAVAGSQMLVWEGKDVTANASGSYNTDRHSRTCVGVTADGKVVMMSLDGRQVPFSCGGTMHELAQIMLEAGCVTAINLDGGGSTTFAARQEGEDEVTLVNRPSDGSERAISSGLIIASLAAPSDVFERASLSVESEYITPGSTVTVSAKGVSPAGTAADLPENLAWQLEDSSMGTVENGIFVSNGKAGDAVVQATVDGAVVGEITIHVVVPDSIMFNQSTIIAPFGKTIKLNMTATYGINTVELKDGDIEFALSDNSLGTVDGYMFTATTESDVTSGTITATYVGDENITASANLTLGKGSEILFDFESAEENDKWLEMAPYNIKGEISTVTSETGKVRSGNSALAIETDFSQTSASGGWIYYGLNWGGEDVFISADAVSYGMWIYVPEEAIGGEVDFRPWHKQADGTYKRIDLVLFENGYATTIEEAGWNYFSCDISSLGELVIPGVNGVISNPHAKAFIEIYNPPSSNTKYGYDRNEYSSINGKFTYYFDDMTVDFSSAVDDREEPVFEYVKASYGGLSDAVDVTGQTISSNVISFTARAVEDTAMANYSGLNVSSAKAYIDGTQITNGFTCTDNGIMTIDDVTLADGLHKVKFSIEDNMGNYISVIREINVQANSDMATIKVVPHDNTLDKILIGSLYYVDIIASDTTAMKHATVKLDLNNVSKWELDHMTVAEGFAATYTIDDIDNIATITFNKVGDTESGELVVASLPIRTWESKLSEFDAKYTYSYMWTNKMCWPMDILVKTVFGEIEFIDNTITSFSSEDIQVDTEAYAFYDQMDKTYWSSKTGMHVHTESSVEDLDPTCSEAGYTGRTFCEECNSIVDWGTEVSSTGHSYKVVDGVLKCECGKLYNGEYEGKFYVDGVVASGWVNDSYYVDGVKLTGVKLVDEYYYDFGEDGISKGKFTGLFYDETVGAYKYAKIGVPATKWVDIDGEWYYFNADYTAANGTLTGKQTSSTETYNFEFEFVDGKLQSGVWVDTGSGIRYYYGPSYYKATNVSNVQWFYVDGVKYAADPNGYRYEGVCALLEANEKIPTAYVFAEDGAFVEVFTGTGLAKNYAGRLFYFVDGVVNHAGLILVDGNYYYIDSTYRAVVNESRYISEEWANGLLPAGTYEFGADGKMLESSIPTPEPTIVPELTLVTENTNITVSNGVLYGLTENMSSTDVAAMFDNSEYVVVSQTLVGTGTTISLVIDGEVVDTLTAMVLGDVNGDGKVLSNDYLVIKKHIASPSLTGVKLEAANVNADSNINTSDYLRVKRHIAGSFDIYA